MNRRAAGMLLWREMLQLGGAKPAGDILRYLQTQILSHPLMTCGVHVFLCAHAGEWATATWTPNTSSTHWNSQPRIAMHTARVIGRPSDCCFVDPGEREHQVDFLSCSRRWETQIFAGRRGEGERGRGAEQRQKRIPQRKHKPFFVFGDDECIDVTPLPGCENTLPE